MLLHLTISNIEIEHAPCDRNILVTAWGEQGKHILWYLGLLSLCNKTADAVVDIVGDIAMITFTKDASSKYES